MAIDNEHQEELGEPTYLQHTFLQHTASSLIIYFCLISVRTDYTTHMAYTLLLSKSASNLRIAAMFINADYFTQACNVEVSL
jgi:hypothetical protein